MKRGDHLISPRIGYYHHGLFLGSDQVIHYSGFVDGFSSGKIEITSLDAFRNGNEIKVKRHKIRTYDREESIDRAYSRLGEDWYSVLINNCEHFVTWCIVGIHSSSQVNSLIALAPLVSKAAASKSSPVLADGIMTFMGKSAARHAGGGTTKVLMSAVAKSATSTPAIASGLIGSSTGTGLAANIVGSTVGTVSGIATGASLMTGAGVTAGLTASVAAAPAVAAVAVAVGVGYGVKKIADWLFD